MGILIIYNIEGTIIRHDAHFLCKYFWHAYFLDYLETHLLYLTYLNLFGNNKCLILILIGMMNALMTRRDREVVDFTRSCVKNKA